MWDFIINIGTWIVSNWESIITFLTSANFATLIGNIVLIRRQNKTVKDNTSSTNDLNESIKSNETIKENINDNTLSVNKLSNEIALFKEEIVSLKDENAELKNAFEQTNSKLSSILEVMSIVYSTIRDETIRTAVNNIIVNAKYTETATRVELEKRVEELKAKVEEDTELLKSAVSKSVEQVKTVINPTKNIANKTSETTVRY